MAVHRQLASLRVWIVGLSLAIASSSAAQYPPLRTAEEEAKPPPPPGKAAAAMDIGGLPLAKLLERDNSFSGLGSFAQLLPRYGISTYVHGIIIGRFDAQTNPEPAELNVAGTGTPTFGTELNAFVGAEIRSRVYAEAQLFYDSNGNTMSVDFAQLDVRLFRDYLFLRGGKFRVPLGSINLYPDAYYLFKLPTLPLFFGEVIPPEWEELGAELYGRYSWGEGRALSYAFYVVNGLEQKVAQPGDPISGGSIRYMNNNWLDSHDADKGVGAQLQLEPVHGLSFGLSGYEGVYTITGQHRLYMLDGHVTLTRNKFTLRGELAATWQETEADTLLKLGGYVLASYRLLRQLEPVVMFDGFRLDGSRDLDRLDLSVGLIYYPFPHKVPSASLRGAYTASWKESGELATSRFALQALVAF